MRAGIEWIRPDIGIIRGGPSFEEFGDPYSFSCMVIRTDDGCEIKGLSGQLHLDSVRAIRQALNLAGIFSAKWERKKPGLVKNVNAK